MWHKEHDLDARDHDNCWNKYQCKHEITALLHIAIEHTCYLVFARLLVDGVASLAARNCFCCEKIPAEKFETKIHALLRAFQSKRNASCLESFVYKERKKNAIFLRSYHVYLYLESFFSLIMYNFLTTKIIRSIWIKYKISVYKHTLNSCQTTFS